MLRRWFDNVRRIEGLENEVEFWKVHYKRAENRCAEEWLRAEAWRKYAEELRAHAKNLQHALNCYRMADNKETHNVGR